MAAFGNDVDLYYFRSILIYQKFESGAEMLVCLMFNIGSFLGGGVTGIKLKQKKMLKEQTAGESEVSQQ
jgi:hypothetical protein